MPMHHVSKHTKKITTNSVLYLASSGMVAAYGVYKKDTYLIAFAMWMVQAANYFKKDKRTDVNGDAARAISLEDNDGTFNQMHAH